MGCRSGPEVSGSGIAEREETPLLGFEKSSDGVGVGWGWGENGSYAIC